MAKASTLTASSGVAQPLTTYAWAAMLLQDAGLPVTINNVNNVTAWINAESGGNRFESSVPGNGTPGTTGNWLRDNNPLNVAGYYGGTYTSYDGGAWGNYTYPSVEAGISATAQEINSPAMTSIKNALASNAPPALFSSALTSAGWAAGGYGGAQVANGSGWNVTIAGNPTSGPTNKAELTSYLGDIGAAIAGAPGQAAGNAAAPVLGATSSVTGLISDVTNPTFWKRIGVFALGGSIFLFGAVVFFVSSDTGKRIASTAAKAAIA